MKRQAFAALLLACACGPGPAKDKEVVEARRAPCSQMCEQMLGPCGAGPSDAFKTVPECVQQCVEVKGAWASSWAHDPETEIDVCFEEFTANIECLTSLTCEQQRQVATAQTNELPADQRPCFIEQSNMSTCKYENRAKEGAK
jgi:hypothetical protein